MSIYNGKNLKIEVFGASHADRIGVNICGLPAGEAVDMTELRDFLKRRRPGLSELVSPRNEPDEPMILSGIKDGMTDGCVLSAVIYNTDIRRQDYEGHIPRPGHADFTAWMKYGLEHDMSGGGEFSGRMTAPLCIAGGICKQYLKRRGIDVCAGIHSIGGLAEGFEELIREVKLSGDSVGGIVECVISGVPTGLGAELFDGLEGRISSLVFSVPAVKGIEFGAGFGASKMRGSEHNDEYFLRDGRIVTETNNHGGILGGISSGMPIVFRAAIKPTPSIARQQRSVDMDAMCEKMLSTGGRHDPCIVPRAVPAIEAAAAIAIVDELISFEKNCGLDALRRRIDSIDSYITALFVKRMELCEEIAEYKIQNGIPTLDSVREEQKLRDIAVLAGSEYSDATGALYREIFRISRDIQDKLR